MLSVHVRFCHGCFFNTLAPSLKASWEGKGNITLSIIGYLIHLIFRTTFDSCSIMISVFEMKRVKHRKVMNCTGGTISTQQLLRISCFL